MPNEQAGGRKGKQRSHDVVMNNYQYDRYYYE